MPSIDQHAIEQTIIDAIRPTWSEVVRSKKAILEIVADRASHGVAKLQRCLLGAEGLPEHVDRRRVEVAIPDTGPIESVVNPLHAQLGHFRFAHAASLAIVDLVALGLIVGVAESPIHQDGDSLVRNLNIGYRYQNTGRGVPINLELPHLDAAYRLAPRLAYGHSQWFADPDVFTADLAALQLDPQTERCITEALTGYRNGLYLSAANMLAAASEGAWYAAGESLRHPHSWGRSTRTTR